MSESLRIRRSGFDDVELDASKPFRGERQSFPSAEFKLLQSFSGPGAAAPRELRVRDDSGQVVARHRMTKPLALVGHCRTCDILLAHSDVSFRHAWLQVLGGRLLAVDLQSRTGIRWPKGRRNFGWLEPGESLHIGPYQIQYLAENALPGPMSLPACDPRQLFAVRSTQSSITLEQLNGPEISGSPNIRTFPILSNITLVGSGRQCQLRLRHPHISRVHCGLLTLGTELWVVDLLGKSGTRLNGALVRLARLSPDSILEIGPFQYAVHYPNGWTKIEHAHFAPSPRRLEDDRDVDGQNAAWRSFATDGDNPPSVTTGYSEQFVMSLMDRMLAMHQQMMTQSQQQMLLMTQMLGAMQQNHQDVLREEIQCLHEITREIQQLHADSLEKAVGQSANQPQQASPDSIFIPMLVGALLQSASQSSPSTSAVENDTSVSAPAADPPEAFAPIEAATEQIPSSLPDPLLDTFPAPHAQDDGTAPRVEIPEVEAEQDTTLVESDDEPVIEVDDESLEPTSRSSNDILHHVWLAERMHKLQRERESRLKRIFQILTGQGP